MTPAEIIRLHVLIRTLELSVSDDTAICTDVHAVRVMRLVALMGCATSGHEGPGWSRRMLTTTPYRCAPTHSMCGPWIWRNADWLSVMTGRGEPAGGVEPLVQANRRLPRSNTRRRNLSIAALFGLAAASALVAVSVPHHVPPAPAAQRSVPPAAGEVAAFNVEPRGPQVSPGEPGDSDSHVMQEATVSAPDVATGMTHSEPPVQGGRRPVHRASEAHRLKRPVMNRHEVVHSARSKQHRIEVSEKRKRDGRGGRFDDEYGVSASSSEIQAVRASREPRTGAANDEWMQSSTQRRLTEIPDQFSRAGD